MKAYRGLLSDIIHWVSFDQIALSVKFKKFRHELSAVRTRTSTVSGQLTDEGRLKEEAEKKTTDVEYERKDARAMITEFKGRESFEKTCRL